MKLNYSAYSALAKRWHSALTRASLVCSPLMLSYIILAVVTYSHLMALISCSLIWLPLAEFCCKYSVTKSTT